jgi:diacylglycerol kinase family enzyme
VLKTVFLYHRAPSATIVCDDEELVLPAIMVCITNGPREGGSFLVAPQGQPDQGLFGLCVAREVSRRAC